VQTSESKNSTIKSGGVLTVKYAHKIVRQEDDMLEKVRKVVECADAQMKNMYRIWIGEAAKVACKYRLNGRLELLYIADQEGIGWSLCRG
jgi:hypothetical protein